MVKSSVQCTQLHFILIEFPQAIRTKMSKLVTCRFDSPPLECKEVVFGDKYLPLNIEEFKLFFN